MRILYAPETPAAPSMMKPYPTPAIIWNCISGGERDGSCLFLHAYVVKSCFVCFCKASSATVYLNRAEVAARATSIVIAGCHFQAPAVINICQNEELGVKWSTPHAGAVTQRYSDRALFAGLEVVGDILRQGKNSCSAAGIIKSAVHCMPITWRLRKLLPSQMQLCAQTSLPPGLPPQCFKTRRQGL